MPWSDFQAERIDTTSPSVSMAHGTMYDLLVPSARSDLDDEVLVQKSDAEFALWKVEFLDEVTRCVMSAAEEMEAWTAGFERRLELTDWWIFHR